MKSGKRVTMKDVVLEAGVTTSTVSLVLKGNPSVSIPTRDKVIRIAERLKYRRNPYISALMTTRRKGKLPASSPVLAFGTAFPTSDSWRRHSTYYRSYYEGARSRASQRGYRLENFWLGEQGSLGRRVSEVLYARNIPGILLAPFPCSLSSLPVDWRQTTVVALGFSFSEPMLHRVACDHFHSMMIALRRCHALGYRRMGLALTKDQNERVDGRWLAAFHMEKKRLSDVKVIPPLIMTEWEDVVLEKWLQREQPDVVIGASGEQLQRALSAIGFQIPKDLGILTLASSSADSPCSGIFQNPALLAARAVDLLIDEIGSSKIGLPKIPNTLLLDGVWNPGATLRKGSMPIVEGASKR